MTSQRIAFLDMLRGFAISGILLVNIGDITNLGMNLPVIPFAPEPLADQALNYLVGGRFVPIFEFMFGISMGLILRGLRARGHSPWPQLVRRMVALLGFSAALLGLGWVLGDNTWSHAISYPGELLVLYASGGLIVLPLVLLLPRWALLGVGTAGTLVTFAISGGGAPAIPGLFCLGAACTAYGVPERLEVAGRGVRPVFWGALVLSAAALAWQTTEPGDPRFTTAGSDAGLVMAVLYICALSLAWQTRARGVLSAMFTPLGRMAFTNYVGSLIVAPIGWLLDFHSTRNVLPALGVAVVVLVVQSLASRWWLARFTYGPLEWCWRVVTRWERVPLRRQAGDGVGTPSSAGERAGSALTRSSV